MVGEGRVTAQVGRRRGGIPSENDCRCTGAEGRGKQFPRADAGFAALEKRGGGADHELQRYHEAGRKLSHRGG